MTFITLHRNSCSIIRETQLKSVSLVAEGTVTLPLYILNINSFLRRMSFPLHDSDKLIKQTYSVYVFLPEDRGQDITRKWHLSV
jgi:hypothetical protein